MKIKDVMTPNVAYLNLKSTAQQAAQLMKDKNIGAIPVEENNKLIGMVTDRDLAINLVAQNRSFETPLSDFMTKGIKYCYSDEEADIVCQNMSDLKVRRLPVIDHNKKLVGLISIGDLIKTDSTQKIAASALGTINNAS